MAATGFGGVGALPAWYHLGTHSGVVVGVVCLVWAEAGVSGEVRGVRAQLPRR